MKRIGICALGIILISVGLMGLVAVLAEPGTDYAASAASGICIAVGWVLWQ